MTATPPNCFYGVVWPKLGVCKNKPLGDAGKDKGSLVCHRLRFATPFKEMEWEFS